MLRKTLASASPPTQYYSTTVVQVSKQVEPVQQPLVAIQQIEEIPFVPTIVPPMQTIYSMGYNGIQQQNITSYTAPPSGSIGSLLTTVNTNTSYYAPYDFQGGGSNIIISTFSTLVVSTLFSDFINTSTLNTSTVVANDIDSEIMNTSTLNVAYVDLDGQVLTANATELLLNGIPLATVNNISSITDWSLYPMISTLDGANENMSNVNTIYASAGNFTTLNSLLGNYSTINSFSGNYSTLTANSLTVNTFIAQSTITSFSTITTIDIQADEIFASTILTKDITADNGFINAMTGFTVQTDSVSANSGSIGLLTLGSVSTGLLSVNANKELVFNGSTITAGSGGDASSWSAFPATQTVNMNTFGINNGGAFNATSLATTGNIATFSDLVAGNNVTAGNSVKALSILGSNSVGSLLDVSALRDVLAGNNIQATNTITALNNNNDTNLLQGATTIYGGLNGTLSFTTNAGLNGFRATTLLSAILSAGVAEIGSGGATTINAGGVVDVSSGGSITLNPTGSVNVTGSGILNANSIGPQSGSLSIGSTTIVNSGTIYTNVLSAPSIVPSLAGQTSSIVGIDLIAENNSFIAKNMIVSTFTASTITANTLSVTALETASIERVSTLNASSITSYFGSISTLNISTLNSVSVNSILPNPPTFQIYVSKTGSDTLGTGSIMQPFLTIAKALTRASAFSDTNIVTILLTPGNYTENVSITRNNTFINGLSVNSQEVSITGLVSFTTTTTTIGYIVGGVVGLTITGALTFSSTALVPIVYTALSGVINGISGTIPLTLSQASTTNSFSFSTQGMVITPVDTIGISINNVRASLIQTLVTGTTTLVQTTGNGAFTIFGSTLTNTNATATAPPIVKLANTVAVGSGAMAINNSYLTYTSATVDTGLNKCCVQLSTTTTATTNLLFNFLSCEGARVTNGTVGQYLCVQNPGSGVITFAGGGNFAGTTAFRFPTASAKFSKTAYPGCV